MKLHIINSNSKGNAYILESSNGEALLLECGVRFDELKRALGFNLKRVVGCLVTHEHQDHCKAVHEVMAAGIDVWSAYDTHIAMRTNLHHRARVTFSGDGIACGNFKIKAFDVKHDAAAPLGYLINHPECGTVLFLTDSYYCEYKFTGLNNIIIEANYCQTILDKRVTDGANPKFLRDRVITSHMSLATTKQTLKAYDLSKVNNIVLIHLSDGNSDESRFKKEVEETTGKMVHVANADMIIDFNKTVF
jgi:phosphoribosyl 1,2-cyclic phosphodiesterase